jgi:ferritin-like protein
MASEGLHEAAELLDEETVDHHRAMTSLCEELEAIDWYDQRVKATSDASLAAVLAHNRDEEKEHASMTLEWLRRRDPVLDRHLRTYLFRTEPITEIEVEAEAGAGPGGGAVEPGAGEASGSLGIGSLKGHGS